MNPETVKLYKWEYRIENEKRTICVMAKNETEAKAIMEAASLKQTRGGDISKAITNPPHILHEGQFIIFTTDSELLQP